MKHGVTLLLVICFGWVFSSVQAAVPPFHTITHIAAVQQFIESTLIKQKHISPDRILVVFDDDNTLLTTSKKCPTPEALSCQYLGGVAWDRWQHELLKKQPHSPDLVAKTEAALYRVQALLFSVVPLELIEPDSVQMLQSLRKQHMSVMIETARSPDESFSTWRQLVQNHLLLSTHPIPNRLTNYALQARKCGMADWDNQPVAVEKGVFYVSGRDKGKMLLCLLHYWPGTPAYQAIVMVDDDANNLLQVHDALAASYDLTLFRYARLDQAVADFLTGPQSARYKAQATLRWKRVVRALSQALPIFNL